MMNLDAIKASAREILKREMWPLLLGYILAVVLPTVLGGASSYSSSSNSLTKQFSSLGTEFGKPEFLVFVLILLGVVTIILLTLIPIIIVTGLAQSLFRSAYQRLCLTAVDGASIKTEELTDVKDYWKKLVWLNFHRGLRVFAWSLLFIIPGIVAAYSYSMAQYIMFENPEKTPQQCLSESLALMNGKKSLLFSLDVSFIGWWFLAGVTGGLAGIFVGPYHMLSRAGFYSEIRNHQIPVAAPVGFVNPEFEHIDSGGLTAEETPEQKSDI